MGAQAVRLSNVDIDNALKNKDFEVLFQPIFDLGNGALARMETFVRWRHPKLGLLPPGAFISFFESQGRMGELTRYVLGTALREYKEWRGPWPPGLSVNLALSDLSDDAFTSHFTKLLRDNDFPADLITLECPMPPVDMPIEAAAAHFARIADTGARLAIEVRGRANELLRSLDPFPFDEIKTGGSAILRFARTVRGPGLSAIADLLEVANKANAAITAVGVEDQASLSALRGLGFTAAQGNHLGKVGDLKEFRPHRINEVRTLLGLDPLSADNVAALFRTEAPALQTADASDDSDAEDGLIDRLNERAAQFDAAGPAGSKTQDKQAEDGGAPAELDEEKKARAKEKAKALALAKRAKMRDARKNAAIERAKSKAAGKPVADVTEVPDGAVAPPTAAREMQERLSRAFTSEDAGAAASAPRATLQEGAREGTPLLFTQQELAQPRQPAQEPAAKPQPQPAPSETIRAEAKDADAKQAAEKPAAKSEGKAESGALPARDGAHTPTQNTVERAVAAEMAAMQQAAARKTAATAGGLIAPVSLSVGPSGAYFQPGIKVGAAALPGHDKPVPPAPVRTPKTEAPKPDAPNQAAPRAEKPAAPPKADAPPPKPREAEARTPEPEAERPLAAPAKRPVAKDTGDLHNEGVAPREAPKRRKAKRRYVLVARDCWSTNFWPRSWKRAWRRRAMVQAARKSQRDDTQAAE